MFFGKKKAQQEEALLRAAVELKEIFQEQLGNSWYLSIDRAFPCRVSDGERCEPGHHPAIVVGPSVEIMKEQFRMNSQFQSAEKAPNMAVFYGHYSQEIGFSTFFLHDIQGTMSSDRFLAYKSIVCVPSDPQVISLSLLKIRKHFDGYLK
jgi:hypothetical protein